MIMSEWTRRVSIIYRWCASWIANKVAHKLPPLSNQASSGIMKKVLSSTKLSLSLLFPSSVFWWGLATFTVVRWHSPNDIGWKARNVPVSAGFKPLHFITAQCFIALYVTRQWYSDSQASNVQHQHLMCTLVVCLKDRETERESKRQTYRHAETDRKLDRKIKGCCYVWHGAAPMKTSQQTKPAPHTWMTE